MECSPKEEFYGARMVLSMSSSRRNYCSPLQGDIERCRNINKGKEV
jgi:hypothetical protein